MPIYKGFLKEASTLPEERIEKLGTVKISGHGHCAPRRYEEARVQEECGDPALSKK